MKPLFPDRNTQSPRDYPIWERIKRVVSPSKGIRNQKADSNYSNTPNSPNGRPQADKIIINIDHVLEFQVTSETG